MSEQRKQRLSRTRSNTPTPSESKYISKGIRIGKEFGRVKVFARIRKFNQQEKNSKETLPYRIQQDGDKTGCNTIVLSEEKSHQDKIYSMDHVFSPTATNQEVCDVMTPPLVSSAMNGFNGTLMAYGQTGSGKTFTLMSESGITKNLIDRCFSKIQSDRKHVYKVTVSYLQIYQEKIFDLLSSDQKNFDLILREDPKSGVYVENLTEYVVRTPTEVLELVASGKKRLVFAETKMNRSSSRSHAVLQLRIEKTLEKDAEEIDIKEKKSNGLHKSKSMSSLDLRSFGKDVIIKGHIYICDLAGSERIKRTGASGERLSEAQSINSSLLELGNVIQALADEKTRHVPFRNSILTRLLQESLGGNCKTSLIICLSPSSRDMQETKSTLNFGARAMQVKNAAYVNMEVDFKSLSDQLFKKLQAKDDEVAALKTHYNEQIERERESFRAQFENDQEANILAYKLQTQTMEEEVTSWKSKMENLQNVMNSKDERIKQLEDSILSVDDQLNKEKQESCDLLSIQNNTLASLKRKEKMDQCFIIDKILDIIEHFQLNCTSKQVGFNELLTEISRVNEEIPQNDYGEPTQRFQMPGDEIYNELLKRLSKVQEKDKGNNTDPEMCSVKHYLFFQNITNQIKQELEWMSAQEKIDKFENIERLRLEKLKSNPCKEVQTTENKNNFFDFGIQVEMKPNVETCDKNVGYHYVFVEPIPIESKETQTSYNVNLAEKFTSTDTVMERSIKTQTEDINFKNNSFEAKDISTQTLNHLISGSISDVYSTNVMENPKLLHSRDIFLGFGNTLDRIEGMVKAERFNNRPSCSIATRFGLGSYFREEDIIRRQTLYDQKYDVLHSSKFSSRFYENSRPSSRPSSPSVDFKSNFMNDTDSDNLKSLYSTLMTKYKTLETVSQKLRHENDDLKTALENLKRTTMSDDKMDQQAVNKNSVATQTLENYFKKSNVKIAHIKPRVSDEVENYNSIHGMELNDEITVRNHERNFLNTSRDNLASERSVRAKVRSKSPISQSPNLSRQTLNQKLTSDFVMNNSSDSIANVMLYDLDTSTNVNADKDTLAIETATSSTEKPLNLDVKSPYQMEPDVTFSKFRRSSWSLSERLKSRKKDSFNIYQQFIQ